LAASNHVKAKVLFLAHDPVNVAMGKFQQVQQFQVSAVADDDFARFDRRRKGRARACLFSEDIEVFA
jgi:hypothetical protein